MEPNTQTPINQRMTEFRFILLRGDRHQHINTSISAHITEISQIQGMPTDDLCERGQAFTARNADRMGNFL